jgi:hypothetical protein
MLRLLLNCNQLMVRKAGFHPSGAAPLGTPGLPPLIGYHLSQLKTGTLTRKPLVWQLDGEGAALAPFRRDRDFAAVRSR